MRIITGIAKGRKLKAPEGLDTRPTADRVKVSLFNIIASQIIDAKALDLFAGTGNLGLEALSRGASGCTFVEQNKTAYRVLCDNITSLGFDKMTEKYNGEAMEILKRLSTLKKSFDLIFLDPPYGKGLIDLSVANIDKFDLLSEEGIIVSEYDINDVVPEKIGKIALYRTVKYGRTKISFWSREE